MLQGRSSCGCRKDDRSCRNTPTIETVHKGGESAKDVLSKHNLFRCIFMREAEEAARRSAEAQSSVALRVPKRTSAPLCKKICRRECERTFHEHGTVPQKKNLYFKMTSPCNKENLELARALIEQCTKNESPQRPPDSPPSVPTPHSGSLPFNVERLSRAIKQKYAWTLGMSSISIADPQLDDSDTSVRIYIRLEESERAEVDQFQPVNGIEPKPERFRQGDSHVYYHVHDLDQAGAVINMFSSYLLKKNLKSTARAVAGGVKTYGTKFLETVHCRSLRQRLQKMQEMKNNQSIYDEPTLLKLQDDWGKLIEKIKQAECTFSYRESLRPDNDSPKKRIRTD